MNDSPSNRKELPVLELCNKYGEPNPISGDGPLGRKGDRGRDGTGGAEEKELVEHLQKMLKTLGYDLGTSGPNNDGVDGKFGSNTERAVIDFQEKNKDWESKRLKPDGLVGPRTADALNRAMVGIWYDLYQTPKELVEDKLYFALTLDILTRGLSIEPGKAKGARLILVKPIPTNIQTIILEDPFLGILSGVSVTVKYPDGSEELLTTDEDGMVKVRAGGGSYVDLEFVTELEMHQMRVFVVLDDVSTPKGAWQRLVNLGYIEDPLPPSEPSSDDALAIALEEFQAEHGILPTGELDNRTQSALSSIYDSTTPWEEQEATIIEDELVAEYAAEPKDAVA